MSNKNTSFVNYTFNRDYERKVSEGRVEIRKDSAHGHSRMTHWKQQGMVKLNADFVVEIDVQKIVENLARKAQANRSGKAGALGGLVKVKRLNTREIARDVQDVPIPANWYEVQL